MNQLIPFIQLARLHRPIGIWLLFWPVLWALYFCYPQGIPLSRFLVFFVGAVLTRSAGCVINDIADRHVDLHVKRTAHRPLIRGQVGLFEAWIFLIGLLVAALVLALMALPGSAMWFVALAGLLLLFYPFSKRFWVLPQLVLGLAFGMAIPVVLQSELGVRQYLHFREACHSGALPCHSGALPCHSRESGNLTNHSAPCFRGDDKLCEGNNNEYLLWFIATLWPLCYDLIYAMQDAKDDEKLPIYNGLKILGRYALPVIGSGFFLMWCSCGVFIPTYPMKWIWWLALGGLWSTQLYRLYRNQQEASVIFHEQLWAGVFINMLFISQ